MTETYEVIGRGQRRWVYDYTEACRIADMFPGESIVVHHGWNVDPADVEGADDDHRSDPSSPSVGHPSWCACRWCEYGE